MGESSQLQQTMCGITSSTMEGSLLKGQKAKEEVGREIEKGYEGRTPPSFGAVLWLLSSRHLTKRARGRTELDQPGNGNTEPWTKAPCSGARRE